MKFTTLTTLLTLLISINLTIGQAKDIDSVDIASIKKIHKLHVEREKLHRERMEMAEKEQAVITLELIRLRVEIAIFESKTVGSNILTNNSEYLIILNQKEQEIIEKLKENKEWVELLIGVEYWPEDNRIKAMNNWKEEHNNPNGTAENVKENEKYFQKPIDKKSYLEYSAENDVMLSPPRPACELAYNGWDETIQRARKDTKAKVLFSETDPNLEVHFPKRDFITCYGSLTSIEGGIRILTLDVTIASPKATSLFGGLLANDFIVIKLLDGTKIRLYNKVSDPGVWIPAVQSIFYSGQFLIGLKEERSLRSQEVDSILIRWSKLEDEFEVFELDFFINQFQCLENE